MVSLKLQFFTFFNMIIVGVAIGIVFDFYRVFRGNTNPRRILADIYDLVFSLLVLFVIFIVLIYSNDGRIRVYVFLGVILGQISYYYLLSKRVFIIYIKLFQFCSKIIFKFKQVIIFIYKGFVKIINKTKLLFRKIIALMKGM